MVQEVGFTGANLKIERRFLPQGVGMASLNQKPSEQGDFRPWKVPLAVSPEPDIPSNRITIYRMGRDVPDEADYWLSWTTHVHLVRDIVTSDSTERTAFTGSGSPKWTDNTIGLATAPYPTATRELSVPPPLVAPTVTLDTDGPSGDPRQLYYVYTRVNDIGWESAPSPPTLADAAMPGAIFDLSYSESVPSGNYGVDKVRWYRQQTAANSTVAEYFFIREYAIGASGQEDDARELGEQLATEDWLPLDTNASWLTKLWNQTLGALVGKSLRICVPDAIYAWKSDGEYKLHDEPLAMCSFASRIVVFTTGGAELFTGDPDLGNMNQKQLDLPVIVAPRSLVVSDTFCMWAAEDGLWYYGVDGARCLTTGYLKDTQWAALVPTTMHGYLLTLGQRTLYIGFYNDGTLKGFVIDPTNPNGFYPLDTGYSTGFYDPLLRKLFVLDGDALKEWDEGASFMTASYTGKVHRQVEHTEAEWLELLASGSVTVKVLTEQAGSTDDATALVERMNRAVTRGQHRIPNGTGGRDWQVQISTQGSVQAISVD